MLLTTVQTPSVDYMRLARESPRAVFVARWSHPFLIFGKLEDLIPRLKSLLDAGQSRVVLDNTYPTRISRSLKCESFICTTNE